MYTSNAKFGIGKITGETETTYTVYFEEIDAVKTPMKAFTKVYATIEDAENGLEMKIEAAATKQIESEIATEKIISEGMAASKRIAEINADNAKKLMKNI